VADRQRAGSPEEKLDSDGWQLRLEQAFAAGEAHPLALAEQAVRDCPGDYEILCLAATAALLEDKPERALSLLKRLGKRYLPEPTDRLLTALALGQQKKRTAARSLLDQHGLSTTLAAWRVFPGSPRLFDWLSQRLADIRGEAGRTGRRPVSGKAAGAARKPAATRPKAAAPKPPAAGAPAVEATPVPAGTAPASPVLPPLPRLTPAIPLTLEIDIAAGTLAGAADDGGAWFRLRRAFVHFGLAQGFDELLCLPHLVGIRLYWHQVETVRKVLKQFRGRVLLADEVGLGKTIEAGMVLKEYALRGMADRFLILVPASLVGQWREELETKFGLSCATTADPLLRDDPDRFWRQPAVVASLAVARRRDHAARLAALAYDVVIVDEAHHLRDRASQGYRLVDGLNKRFLLLLSATPVQNSLIELYNLLTLLKPGIFKTQKEFRAAYMVAGKPRQPANAERLRALLRDAMIRNTRAVAALKLPRRHAATLRVQGSDAERRCYAALSALVRRLAAAGTVNRLTLRHLLGTAGSSPAAAALALRHVAGRRPADRTAAAALADAWAAVGPGAKEAALLELLRRNPLEKKLVFIHYRESLEHLAGLLEQEGIPHARFAGDMAVAAKDAAIAAFRDRVAVLLSTESGGEGRNIQFCNTLVNFDIPWNPMAIEQRIGRIDRIGQEREVFVFNLVSGGTLEDGLLRLLDEKINMFELVVGEVGAILGELDDERTFADLVLDTWLETTAAGAPGALDALGERLAGARRQYEEAKVLDDALFGENFETE
jgi:superfamily II DNA or RNA helicase